MKKFLVVMLAFLMLFMMSAGCTPTSEEPQQSDALNSFSPEKTNDTTFEPIVASFLHGAGGSTWPLLSEGVAECVRQLVPGSSITMVPGGAISNAQLVASGEYELCFTFYDTVLDAKNGRGAFEGAPCDNLRVIACVFSTYSQPLCYADEPFNSMAEFFETKPKISLSAHQQGSGVETFNNRLIQAYGYTYEDIEDWGGKVVFANESDTLEMLKDGQIEMFLGGSTPPVSGNIDVNTTRPIKYLTIDSDVIDYMVNTYGYGKATIPQDTYEWLEEDFDTFTAMIVVTCTTDMSDEATYAIAKAINENIDYLCGVHNAAKLQLVDIEGGIICDINEEDIAAGALKYYKEVGLK